MIKPKPTQFKAADDSPWPCMSMNA
jgi:hypothetical protein